MKELTFKLSIKTDDEQSVSEYIKEKLLMNIRSDIGDVIEDMDVEKLFYIKVNAEVGE